MTISEQIKTKITQITGDAHSVAGILFEDNDPNKDSNCYYEIYWSPTSKDQVQSNYRILGRLIKHFEESQKVLKEQFPESIGNE